MLYPKKPVTRADSDRQDSFSCAIPRKEIDLATPEIRAEYERRR